LLIKPSFGNIYFFILFKKYKNKNIVFFSSFLIKHRKSSRLKPVFFVVYLHSQWFYVPNILILFITGFIFVLNYEKRRKNENLFPKNEKK
jgi:hypothetical protein